MKAEIKPFSQDVFLKQIEQFVPILPLKPKKPIVGLYIAFLKSPNFASWLAQRTADVHKQWQNQYIHTLSSGPRI
jgi:hypothetical protein